MGALNVTNAESAVLSIEKINRINHILEARLENRGKFTQSVTAIPVDLANTGPK
jgi:hypothetical protein